MRRNRSIPKMTQTAIVDWLVGETAIQLANNYKYGFSSSIPSKNQDTLEKMVKRGILVSDYNVFFALAPDETIKHTAEIRRIACEIIANSIEQEKTYLAKELSDMASWNYCRFVATNVTRSHFDQPDFSFFEYHYTNDYEGRSHTIMPSLSWCNDEIETASRTEANIQAMEIALARCEIGTIPVIDLSA